MEKLVQIAKSLPAGKQKEMLEWLATDIEKFEKVNLFPDIKQDLPDVMATDTAAKEVKPDPDENLVSVPKKKGRPKKKG